jgi:acetyltransferase-like isoleucine patch superfamily enzyme
MNRTVETLRRALRGLCYAWRRLHSETLLTVYRLQFGGLRVGRNVTLGRGTYLNVASGGRLTIGDNVLIDGGVYLTADGGTLEIGADSYIGMGTVIVAAERVSIGCDALIAAYVTIRDQDHGVSKPGVPYRAQPPQSAPVSIGQNVWLGTHAAVLKGVTIGEGCIVGANAVVTRDLPPNCVAVGVPAKMIRQKTETGIDGLQSGFPTVE